MDNKKKQEQLGSSLPKTKLHTEWSIHPGCFGRPHQFSPVPFSCLRLTQIISQWWKTMNMCFYLLISIYIYMSLYIYLPNFRQSAKSSRNPISLAPIPKRKATLDQQGWERDFASQPSTPVCHLTSSSSKEPTNNGVCGVQASFRCFFCLRIIVNNASYVRLNAAGMISCFCFSVYP